MFKERRWPPSCPSFLPFFHFYRFLVASDPVTLVIGFGRPYRKGRYYQFLSGHAAIGSYPHKRIGSAESNKCGWRSYGKRGSRHYLVAGGAVW